MEKKSLVLILILCLANQSLAGALVPRYAAKPQINIFEQFWEKMNNFVTGGLHLVGSILPLRGLATIAKDLGFPHADSILDALTPTKRIPSRVNTRFFDITSAPTSQRRSDTVKVPDNAGDKYVSLRDEMSSAVGALLGKNDCQKRLACLSGRHLSKIDGASSLGKFPNLP